MEIAMTTLVINLRYMLMSLSLSQKIDKGSTNTLIDQIFSSIDDLIDGRLVCGAGGGGFLQVVLKKGVSKKDVQGRLKTVFQDSLVDVWDCELVW